MNKAIFYTDFYTFFKDFIHFYRFQPNLLSF